MVVEVEEEEASRAALAPFLRRVRDVEKGLDWMVGTCMELW